MLEKCAAVHMASDPNWIARCNTIATEAGFSESYPYLGVDDIARRVRKTPVQFLIAHYLLEDSVLRQTVKAIRHHPERDVKFMPLIVFTRDSGAARLKHFLKMGFDDIITFPCPISHMVTRLNQQVSRKLDYYAAGDYFGPDRRRLLEDDDNFEKRDGGAYTHYVIRRDTQAGIQIVAQHHHKG